MCIIYFVCVFVHRCHEGGARIIHCYWRESGWGANQSQKEEVSCVSLSKCYSTAHVYPSKNMWSPFCLCLSIFISEALHSWPFVVSPSQEGGREGSRLREGSRNGGRAQSCQRTSDSATRGPDDPVQRNAAWERGNQLSTEFTACTSFMCKDWILWYFNSYEVLTGFMRLTITYILHHSPTKGPSTHTHVCLCRQEKMHYNIITSWMAHTHFT